MSVLLLRLYGPMQSWGVQSHFGVRDTGREPSKSGVIGLLAAALGRRRDQPIDDLAALRLGVRVDQEGLLLRDYHIAGKGGYLKASGAIETKNVIVSSRYYLADAKFLVGLESEDDELLACLHKTLHAPHWPLFLGRKAFIPGEPVWLPDGLRLGERLEHALRAYPWLGHDRDAWEGIDRLRLVLEDPNGAQVRPDQPLSFAERRFAPRWVDTAFIPKPPFREEVPCISRA